MTLNFKGKINEGELKAWRETIDSKPYLCAKAVMVGEAVLNQELLPAEEIKRSVDGWGGRPLTIGHPVDNNGSPIDANTPEALEKFGAGMIFNVEYNENDKKLRCHIYFDENKKDKSSEHRAVYDAIVSGNPPLEVSTGYFVLDPIQNSGEYAGEEFQSVQSSIMPNHFAILYGEEKGAFSREMGGGVHVNSDNKQTHSHRRIGKHRVASTGAKDIRTGYSRSVHYPDTWAIDGDKKGAVFAQQRDGAWCVYTPSKRIDKRAFGHYTRGAKSNSLYGAVRGYLKVNAKPKLSKTLTFNERWITTENGSRVLLDDDGTVLAGFGGKYTGQKISDIGKKSASGSVGSIGKDGKVVLPDDFNSNTIFTVGETGISSVNMKYGHQDRKGAASLQNTIDRIKNDSDIMKFDRDVLVRYWQPKRKRRAQTFTVPLRSNRQRNNAQATQLMISELLLQKIKQAQPDVKKVTELYHDTQDGKYYAVFEKNKQAYKVAYDFAPDRGVSIGEYATPVQAARLYADVGPQRPTRAAGRAQPRPITKPQAKSVPAKQQQPVSKPHAKPARQPQPTIKKQPITQRWQPIPPQLKRFKPITVPKANDRVVKFEDGREMRLDDNGKCVGVKPSTKKKT